MEGQPTQQARYCPNCHYPLPAFGTYCSNCSQKYTSGKVPLWALMGDFLESVLNIDSKIFRTVGALCIPGKLSIEYFKGRQKRYFSPLRIFFVMAVIHFAVLGYVGFETIEQQVAGQNETARKRAYMADFLDQLDSNRMKVEPAFANRPGVGLALDSLENLFEDSRADTFSFGYLYYDKTSGSLTTKTLKPAWRDIMEMPEEEFFDKYDIQGFFPRLQARQLVKLNRDGGNFTRYALEKLIWMMVFMMPALATLLKLLYIRRKRYFVEHLVFSFHYHAFAFMIISVVALLSLTQLKMMSGLFRTEVLLAIAFAGILLYMFAAMKRFYRQGWFKTIVKYNIVNFSYIFIFTLFLLLTLLASALMF